MFNLTDRYAIDAGASMRDTADGYLVANPRVARTGIQLYRGSEVGLTGDDASKIIRVFRPESEVFKDTSMKTFAHKPITDDHPPEAVSASNWGRYGKGQLGDEVARDGQFIRVPMVVMDGSTISKVKGGKSELSVGYTCDIAWGAGTSPEGEEYDAMQKDIGVNHVAIVAAARGGKDLRIGEAKVDFKVYADALAAISKGNINKESALADASGHLAKDSKGATQYPVMKDGFVFLDSLRACKTDAVAKGEGDVLAALDNLLSQAEISSPAVKDGTPKEIKMKTIVIDGITVEVGDGPHADVIQRHIKSLGDANVKLTSDISALTATHDASIKLKDGEIAKLTTGLTEATTKVATLETQVKDAVLTPAKLDALVADRQVIAQKAKAVIGDKLVIDGKTDGEIRRQVVDAKLADAAKGWTDDQVKISFDTLTAGIDLTKIADNSNSRPGGLDAMRNVIADGGGSHSQTKDAAIAARDARLSEAWKGPQHKIN
jgi:hypothetical protein